MEIIKNRFKSFLFKVFVAVVGVMLIFLRNELKYAISDALILCADVLIPSLLPFMILASFAQISGIFERESKITSFVMNKIFRLPTAAVTAIIFGFTGGYPVGARIISQLYESGRISKADAGHLIAFCVNGGPAFIVSFAGGMIIGSQKAGYIIFVSVVLSSLLVGLVYARFKKKDNLQNFIPNTCKTDMSSALVASVTSASGGIISVCTWVIAFVSFSCVVQYFINDTDVLNVYLSLAEVTSGLESALKTGGVPFAAGCIAFGGGSVACQLLPSIKKCGIKVSEYLFFRIVNSILVYIFVNIFMKSINLSISVFSQFKAQIHFAPASAALLIMCAVLVFDVASNDKKQLDIFG